MRWLVLVLVLLALFFQLGARGLNEPDEGRYAEAAREMAASGDWLTPRINGFTHLSKPPLTYWSIAASLKLFGVNETTARLPSALAALGALLALYLMVRGAADEHAALWSVVILTTSAMFFLIARLVTADMVLCCWVTWSVWAIWRRSNWLFVFLALGVLTKGPVAVVLPLFAFIGLRPPLREFRWVIGLPVFLALSASWFVALALQNPELWRYFFVREIFQRVATGEHGRSQPWWFLIVVTLGGFLPWSFTLFTRRPLDATTRMFAAWAVLGVLLFSLSQSKLPTYALPLMPPLAALAAMTPPRRWHNALVSVSLVAALLLLTHYLRTRCGLATSWVIAINVVAVIGALAALFYRHAAVVTFLAVVLAVIALLPGIERQLRHNTSMKPLAERVRREDPLGKALVVGHRCLPTTFLFYLQRPVRAYNPGATNRVAVFEFHHPAPGSPLLVTDLAAYRAMLATTQRVFCVASADATETMREETGVAWRELERAGYTVLLSNQP
jgi:4-amino-4-deoxy-L-arabinose transferase-like glycosyltransferase